MKRRQKMICASNWKVWKNVDEVCWIIIGPFPKKTGIISLVLTFYNMWQHWWNSFLFCSKSIDDDSIDETVTGGQSASVDADATTGSVISQLSVSGDNDQLTNENCHDSGIDINDPNAILPPITAKKNYSDADILLSSDWVPPITIAPTEITASPSQTTNSALNAPDGAGAGGRKKASSVSFSVDDNSEHQSSSSDRSNDNNKKNKMLKRLSYPLTWVEGLTGEGKPVSESTESAPNTGDSNQSVFSKVFSRWVWSMARALCAAYCYNVLIAELLLSEITIISSDSEWTIFISIEILTKFCDFYFLLLQSAVATCCLFDSDCPFETPWMKKKKTNTKLTTIAQPQLFYLNYFFNTCSLQFLYDFNFFLILSDILWMFVHIWILFSL